MYEIKQMPPEAKETEKEVTCYYQTISKQSK